MSIAIESDKLASAGKDGYIQMWSMSTWSKLFQCKHDDWVNCIMFWQNYLISASSDRTVKIWSKNDGQLIKTLQHDQPCYNFDINNGIMAVASFTGVTIWALADHKKLKHIELGQISDVRCQGNQIIAGAADGRVLCIKYQ